MAALFVKLAQDRDCRVRLGARARIEAQQQHSLQAAVAAYETLYDASVEHPSGPFLARPTRA